MKQLDNTMLFLYGSTIILLFCTCDTTHDLSYIQGSSTFLLYVVKPRDKAYDGSPLYVFTITMSPSTSRGQLYQPMHKYIQILAK